MELIRGLHNLRPEHRGCAVTLGNFDGVHLGHQAVIAQLVARARELSVPSTLVLFEPQPREYFRPTAAPARLMRLREKLLAVREQAIDRVLCVRFNARFAALSADEFMQRVLVQGLGARHVVVGDDFRFGRDRQGDFDLLRQAGKRHGFEVAPTPTVVVAGERVSSTRIRTALAAGDLTLAEQLLGRPYRICGRVAQGNKLGRQLGVPTANLRLQRHAVAVRGIYTVAVHGLDGAPLPAVASVGTRPTVGGTEELLEVHLLNFARDIYGAPLAVDFLHKQRDEYRFDSVDQLRAQMERDIEQARAYFANRAAVTRA